jgi:hypothetical protein
MNPDTNYTSREITPRISDYHWPSAILLGASLVAILFLWGLSALLVLIGLIGLYSSGMTEEYITPLFLLASGLAFCGVLLLPSAWYSFLRLTSAYKPEIKQLSPKTTRFLIVFLLLFFPLVVISGNWITGNTQLSWILLPPLHVLAIGVPIFWLLLLGLRGLSIGSAQRDWGAFGAGITLSPILIMILEITALLAVIFLGLIYIFSQPDLLAQLDFLINRLSYAPQSPLIIQRIITPYLLQPGVVYTIFAFIAVIVPLIEEALKPIGVWLLFRSGLTPAAGFAAGVLGGAGFAIFENIMFSINLEDWIFIVSARTGTSLMHIVTGGITGWALASAWRYGKYLQLGLFYLVAVSIHGLWNGLILLGVVEQVAPDHQVQSPVLMNLVNIAPFGLGILVVLCLSLLVYFNWSLRRTEERLQPPYD